MIGNDRSAANKSTPADLYYHKTNRTPSQITYLSSLHPMPAEVHVPPELIQFKLTKEDLELLEAKKEEWRTGDRSHRNQIAQKVYDELKKKNPHWSREEKDLRKKVSSSSWKYFGYDTLFNRAYTHGFILMEELENHPRNSRASRNGPLEGFLQFRPKGS